MGQEIAWRRFTLTSANGAATAPQPQCRDAPQWEGLELNSKEKEGLRKDFEHKSGKKRKKQFVITDE